MQQLSGLDASFLYLETPTSPMHVGSVGIYDQSSAPDSLVTFRAIIANTERRLHLARAFRQRAVRVPLDVDHPWWIEDPDFDLEYHLRHLALPKPGDWRQLCIQVARLHGRPLDATRPLWEFNVIEGLDHVEGFPPGSFALMSKVHHAAVDGVSGVEMVGAIHDLAPDGEPAPPEASWQADSVPSAVELLARAGVNNARRPLRMARVAGRTVPALRRARPAMRRDAAPIGPIGSVPRTRFNGPVSGHRVFDGRSFPLDELKKIKGAVPGATINDAVLTLVGGALRAYLEDKDELPEESLVAMAPISVRADAERADAGNQVSAMAVALHSDIAHPIVRLERVHESTQASKALTGAIGARLLTDYTEFLPGALAGVAARVYTRMALANRTRPVFNTVVTNIPGPQFPLYSSGARLVAWYGVAPIVDGMGLIHPVLSYDGTLTISFTGCREQLPDPATYAGCLEASFEALAELA